MLDRRMRATSIPDEERRSMGPPPEGMGRHAYLGDLEGDVLAGTTGDGRGAEPGMEEGGAREAPTRGERRQRAALHQVAQPREHRDIPEPDLCAEVASLEDLDQVSA